MQYRIGSWYRPQLEDSTGGKKHKTNLTLRWTYRSSLRSPAGEELEWLSSQVSQDHARAVSKNDEKKSHVLQLDNAQAMSRLPKPTP